MTKVAVVLLVLALTGCATREGEFELVIRCVSECEVTFTASRQTVVRSVLP